MPEPQIINAYDPGLHNSDLAQATRRLKADASWKDLSTIILRPVGSKQGIPPKIVASWESMIKPPNNRCTSMWAVDCEVGDAYTYMIEQILAHPDLGKWKFLLCLEHDNAPPPDGLVRLQKQMEQHPELGAIGGLYFTKGFSGVAQIWGDRGDPVLNFRPQPPDLNGGLKECYGTGMGFTLFRMEMFKDPRLRKPWFKTPANPQEGAWSQDLYFWSDAYKFYRCAIDCSVKVGHWDNENQIMW